MILKLIAINKIKGHERTSKRRVEELVRAIQKDGVVKQAIIVDRRSSVVLDGHHRVEALKRLGATRVPAYLVTYQSQKIRVYLRRSYLQMHMIKQAVLHCGITGKIFPTKTTRHVLPHRQGIQKIVLSTLL